MHHSRYLLAFAGSLLLAAPAPAREKPQPEILKNVWIEKTQNVRSTIYEERKVETSQNPSMTVQSLKVAPSRVTFSLALPKKVSAGGSSLTRFRYDERALAAFTGGFLDTSSPATPVGLVLGRNTIQNDICDDPVMTAVVCYSADPIKPVVIMATEEFSFGKTKGDCIQTGPFLTKETDFDALEKALENMPGGYYPFARGQFQRGFLLENARNEIVIGVAPRISLFALRELLLKPVQEDGFGASVAVALSGAGTAGWVIEDEGKRITAGNIRTLLPNAVVIKER
jgi:hypothetical protein